MADPETKPVDDPAMLLQPNYPALIEKHRAEIERIMMLTPEEQEKELSTRYGLDPHKIENHYKDLQMLGAELRHQGASANRKTLALAITAFSAGATASIVKRKAIHESGLVQAIVGSLVAFSAGFVATLAGTSLFAGNLKKEGKALAIEARDAFEREMAVAIENKQRADAAASLAPAPQPQPGSQQPMTDRVPARDASFAAQTAADKLALASQQAGRA
jgi:hypothetical protein